MWDLVPWPGVEPGSPALGAQSLSRWATRDVPVLLSFSVCADFLPQSRQCDLETDEYEPFLLSMPFALDSV